MILQPKLNVTSSYQMSKCVGIYCYTQKWVLIRAMLDKATFNKRLDPKLTGRPVAVAMAASPKTRTCVSKHLVGESLIPAIWQQLGLLGKYPTVARCMEIAPRNSVSEMISEEVFARFFQSNKSNV